MTSTIYPPEMKTYRVYFNRQMDWPMVWCVDEGDISTQIRCRSVDTNRAIGHVWRTVLGPKKIKLIPNEPVAWVDVTGVLRVELGIAFIGRTDD